MVFMRKFGVVVFALLLFVGLLTLAFSTSSNVAFTNSEKMKSWLTQSNLYGAFVENAIGQAERTAGTDNSGGISLSDTVVKESAQSTFSAKQLENDVNTFLDSNYAWLEGKSDKPDFSIDLSAAKESFAQRVGQYVTTYLNGLQVCTSEQLATFDPQTADPLTLSCRPSSMDPTTEGSAVADQIATSTEFLSNPVITPQNINPDGDSETRPYYQDLSSLPQIYQINKKVPWAAAILTVLLAIGVFLLAGTKRQGVKITSIVLALAGLVLVSTKFYSNQVTNSLQQQVFNANTVGQLQKALTTFFSLLEDQLVKVDLWFGIAYLAIAAIGGIALYATRQRGIKMSSSLLSEPAASKPKAKPAASTKKPQPAKPKIAPTPKPAAQKRPPRRKPPRLVQ